MVALTLVERIVQWVEPAFATAGYLIIAGAVLMERSIFVGLIIPGDVILALGGVYAAQSKLSLVTVIVIGAIAAITGESIGYWLGRRFGRRLIVRIPLVRRLAHRLDASEVYFRRHGGKTVAIGRYATAAGAFVPFSAGVGRMPYGRFLAFDVPAVLVWATAITMFGYAFGRNLAFIDRTLSRFGYTMLGLLAGFLLGTILYRRIRARRSSSRADGAGSPDGGPTE
jgi:membrane-associated protein